MNNFGYIIFFHEKSYKCNIFSNIVVEMAQMNVKEKTILRELIKDPRISDNQLSRRTGIPVMTVNRKRKQLESSGILCYFAHIRRGIHGTETFTSRQLHVVKFRSGITKQQFLQVLRDEPEFLTFGSKQIFYSVLGEKDGHLALSLILCGKTDSDIVEFFNGFLVPMLKKHLGEECIEHTSTIRLDSAIRVFHNYLPDYNMEKGKLKKNWDNNNIFVC